MKIPYNAKIVFYCDSGANHYLRKEVCVSDLATETEWNEMSEGSQRGFLDDSSDDWVSGILDKGWYQKDED